MSYEMQSLLVQIIGLVMVIICATLIRRMKPMIYLSILIMWSANIIGQIKIMGGDTAFAGFIILPLHGIALSYIVIRVIRLVQSLITRSRSCAERKKLEPKPPV